MSITQLPIAAGTKAKMIIRRGYIDMISADHYASF